MYKAVSSSIVYHVYPQKIYTSSPISVAPDISSSNLFLAWKDMPSSLPPTPIRHAVIRGVKPFRSLSFTREPKAKKKNKEIYMIKQIDGRKDSDMKSLFMKTEEGREATSISKPIRQSRTNEFLRDVKQRQVNRHNQRSSTILIRSRIETVFVMIAEF